MRVVHRLALVAMALSAATPSAAGIVIDDPRGDAAVPRADLTHLQVSAKGRHLSVRFTAAGSVDRCVRYRAVLVGSGHRWVFRAFRGVDRAAAAVVDLDTGDRVPVEGAVRPHALTMKVPLGRLGLSAGDGAVISAQARADCGATGSDRIAPVRFTMGGD